MWHISTLFGVSPLKDLRNFGTKEMAALKESHRYGTLQKNWTEKSDTAGLTDC